VAKTIKSEPPKNNQRDRFIEAARKAGASEDETDFDKALRRVAKQKPDAPSKPK
jgi:hypothetical protein